jgi:hypothetical protein
MCVCLLPPLPFPLPDPSRRTRFLQENGISSHFQLYNDAARQRKKKATLAAAPVEGATFAPRLSTASAAALRRVLGGREGDGGTTSEGEDVDVVQRLLERGRQ